MIYNSHTHTPCILIYNSSQFCCKSIPGTLLHTTASLMPSLKFIDRGSEDQDNSQGLGRASLNATVNTHGPNTNTHTHTRSNTSSIFQQISRLMFSSSINQQRMRGKEGCRKGIVHKFKKSSLPWSYMCK